ncbi:hypothetical protein LTS18_010722 [Coniosporium uncinatum]|uniref:Uncharacterized protein n=1 Tax=Coniosporium uncinatum TaxID=93489 RepID=A0ACC3DL42_9PEZI|nr:hypothetical protein LTS18_010722 [Coniosporium uncinatum]
MAPLYDFLPLAKRASAGASIFTFTAGPLPLPFILSFATPSVSTAGSASGSTSTPTSTSPNFVKPHAATVPTTPPSRKRIRPLIDIDGFPSEHRRKKQRLRLTLITSRLSRPYSKPATHIVDRGSSQIAVWAKQRGLLQGQARPLRKAAILNRIRRLSRSGNGSTRVGIQRTAGGVGIDVNVGVGVGSSDTQQISDTVTRTSLLGTLKPERRITDEAIEGYEARQRHHAPPRNTSTPNMPIAQQTPNRIPRRDYSPLPPSPLGLSNYDALDLDEGLDDLYLSTVFSVAEEEGEEEEQPYVPHPALLHVRNGSDSGVSDLSGVSDRGDAVTGAQKHAYIKDVPDRVQVRKEESESSGTMPATRVQSPNFR